MKSYFKITILLMAITICSCSSDDSNSNPNEAPEAFNLIGVTNRAVQVELFPMFSWADAVDPENAGLPIALF